MPCSDRMEGPKPKSSNAQLALETSIAAHEKNHVSEGYKITRRSQKNGSVALHVQCVSCLDSVHVIKKSEIPEWETLPEFDISKLQNQKEQSDKFQEWRTSWALSRDNRRAEYQKFLCSPEWRSMRERVLQRDAAVCQSCLSQVAVEVHHRSYEFGWLPSAWHLVSVCRACHEELHEASDAIREETATRSATRDYHDVQNIEFD